MTKKVSHGNHGNGNGPNPALNLGSKPVEIVAKLTIFAKKYMPESIAKAKEAQARLRVADDELSIYINRHSIALDQWCSDFQALHQDRSKNLFLFGGVLACVACGRRGTKTPLVQAGSAGCLCHDCIEGLGHKATGREQAKQYLCSVCGLNKNDGDYSEVSGKFFCHACLNILLEIVRHEKRLRTE